MGAVMPFHVQGQHLAGLVQAAEQHTASRLVAARIFASVLQLPEQVFLLVRSQQQCSKLLLQRL